ncbi:MAG: outer membrane protein transport protein [Thermodesulfobacteriota bacterium]|nr:outer membrane protein transport protein [Thermodesulfobacteriota bacterium]
MKLQTRLILLIFISVFIFTFVTCSDVLAAFNEQVAVDTKAISLANTCTADPPGLMSAHYNPAGLSLLDDGKTLSNGFVLPFIKRTGRFTKDPDFEGFMSDTWGPDAPYNPDDPLSAHGGPDPLVDTEGTNNRHRMYVPFYGPVDMLVGANLGLASKKKDSKWTFAYANYAPYGGGMAHRDKDDPMRYGCKSLYLQHLIYAAPTAAYQLSDTLSVGISVGMGQTAMGIEVDQRTPNELVAMSRIIGDATKDLEIPVVSEQTLPPPFLGGGLGPYEYNTRLQMDLRDDFTPSFNLGLLWKPRSWFAFGICYQSETSADITGDYKFEYSEQFQTQVSWNGKTDMLLQQAGMLDLPTVGVPYQSGTVTATQKFPQRVQTGIMVKPMEKLKLLFDLHWADWSIIKQDKFVFDQDLQLFRIAKLLGYTGGNRAMVVDRAMKDTWHWSVGMEYQATDSLCLRAGYEKRPSSTNHDLFDALYFLPDMEFVGAGVGLKLPKNIKLDIGFGYLFNNSTKIDNNTSTNFNSTDPTTIVYNPYAGLDYEQETYLYLVSFGITMPLEVQMELLHHQMQMAEHALHAMKKIINKINPFHKKE